jgi:hypothetical protein
MKFPISLAEASTGIISVVSLKVPFEKDNENVPSSISDPGMSSVTLTPEFCPLRLWMCGTSISKSPDPTGNEPGIDTKVTDHEYSF